MRQENQPRTRKQKVTMQRLREGAEQRSARDRAIAEEWMQLEEKLTVLKWPGRKGNSR